MRLSGPMRHFFIFVLLLPFSLLYAAPHGHDIPVATSKKVAQKKLLAKKATTQISITSTAPVTDFQLGIERLRSQEFSTLQGRRVGLLTHAAATDRDGISTITILHGAPGVQLVALYAPEHGLDGQIKANEKFDTATHEETGLPVYSLYGATRKPTPDMLQDIDVMVIDLQDVGVRSYTFISAMKYAIAACFEENIPVIVLDRPNPLGGLKVDGPVLDPQYQSYVGLYQIPYVHGLTIGELALLAQDELAPRKGNLTIIGMTGWRRTMLWTDIRPQLKWRATSPAVPTVGAAFGYACTGLGAQLGGFRHGFGSEYPFRLLSHPRIPAAQLKTRLDNARLSGFAFDTITIPSGLRGAGNQGVYVRITSWTNASPIELSLTMLQIALEINGSDAFADASKNEQDLFNKHWGRGEPLAALQRGRLNARTLAAHWQKEALRWQASAKKYWLYLP